jgi:hypothetical protein
MRGEQSKFLFIDSAVDHGRVSLPPQPFSCHDNESMSFTIVDFTMRRNFPQISLANNTFYIYVSSDQSFYEVTIPIGDYASYTALNTAISSALTTTLSSANPSSSLRTKVSALVSTYVALTRTYAFSLTMAGGASATDIEIRCYHIKDGNVPSGISKNGAFSDVHEILGGEPLKGDINKNSFSRDTADTSILYSKFPASLSTLDALYLRCNLELGNYEAPGLDMFHVDGVQMQNSNIIAKIPIRGSTEAIRQAHEIITFEDAGGDLYQKILPLKNLEHVQFFVTDKRNRSMREYAPDQAEIGMMSFNLTVRWDKFIPPKPEHPRPNGFPASAYPASYGYGQPRI